MTTPPGRRLIVLDCGHEQETTEAVKARDLVQCDECGIGRPITAVVELEP